MKIFSHTIHIIILLIATSCAQEKVLNDDIINAKSIDKYLEQRSVKNQPQLAINRTAFERDFFFYGAFIPMLKSPSGYSLKGRVVRFSEIADRVLMFESPKGHSIASGLESTILLAEFPIIQSDENVVIIDFAKGMTSAFTTRNIHSRSVTANDMDTSEQFKSVLLTASFIKSVEPENDVLTISQIAQWRNNNGELISAEFRYFLREYLPNPNFAKKTAGYNRWVQYFTTPPQVLPPTTEGVTYLAKWDLSKPITFYISSNTPPHFHQAIKNGIYYWNHIFQKEIFKVEEASEGIMAPSPKLNIIQWVPWDNEASAYADMVVDHLTGETMQAQIYIRSGWAFKSIEKLRNQLQEILLNKPTITDLPSIEEDVVLPDIFDFAEGCYLSKNSFTSMSELIENINNYNISNEIIQKLQADVITAVVAHEMGHVLGLRHNLAASTEGNISIQERKESLRNYLADGGPPLSSNKFFSRSVMDVFSSVEDALIGSQIRQLTQENTPNSSSIVDIYIYDKQAIDFGYYNKEMQANTAFCTDDDISKFLDCKRWDATNNSILFSISQMNNSYKQVAIMLANTFIEAISPDRKGGRIAITDVPLSNKVALAIFEQNIKDTFLWFSEKSRFAKIELGFAAFGPQNIAQINQAKFSYIRKHVLEVGVNEALFSLMPPFNSKNNTLLELSSVFEQHFRKRLSEEQKENPSFSLTKKEIEYAINIAQGFLKALEEDVIIMFASIVSRMQFDDPEFQLPIESALAEITKHIILSAKPKEDPTKLPIFSYQLKTREAAAHLLSPALGLLPDWSYDALSSITNELKQNMKRYLNISKDGSANIDSLPREQRQWLIEQNRILSTLQKVRSLHRTIAPPSVDSSNNKKP